jgi:hypothetical protein
VSVFLGVGQAGISYLADYIYLHQYYTFPSFLGNLGKLQSIHVPIAD